MPNDGSAYSDDEIAAMLGHFTRPTPDAESTESNEETPEERDRTPSPRVEPGPVPTAQRQPEPPPPTAAPEPPPPTGAPEPPPPTTAPATNDQTNLLDRLLVRPSTPPPAAQSVEEAIPPPTATGLDDSSDVTDSPSGDSSSLEAPDAETVARQQLRQELKAAIAEAQQVYRKEIKKSLAEAAKADKGGNKKASGKAKADDGSKDEESKSGSSSTLAPPSRFEIKWEKNLRQTKGDPNKLAEVILRLGRSANPEMTKLLKRFVSARKKRVRFATAKALRGITTPEAFYQLLTLLRDRKEKVSRAAAISLTMDANATTLPAILAYARMGSEEQAVVAREIKKLESEPIREDLLELAKVSSHEVVALALIIAGQISDKDDVNDFSPFLNHSSAEVRRAAIEGLLRTNNQQVARFLNDALADPAAEVRARAAVGLAKWPTKNSPKRLLKLLEDDSPQVRRSAAEALKQIATDDLAPALSPYLSKETDTVALIAIIECVARTNPDGNSESLFALSKHEQEEVRIAALSALTRQGDQRVTSSLGTLLDDKDPKVRIKAVTGLGQPKNVEALSSLEDILKNDRDVAVRATAAKSLGQIGSAKAIPALKQAMYDDAAVRCQAVLGLRRIGTADTIPILVERLGDSAPEVRYNAVSALGSMESKEVVPDMARLIEDSNDMVRRATHKALRKLGYNVSSDLRARRFRRFVRAAKGLIPSPQVAGAVAAGILAVVAIGVLVFAPESVGLGPTVFIGRPLHIDISPDGTKVSMIRTGGVNEIWSADDGQMQIRKLTEARAEAGLFTADGRKLKLLCGDKILHWDLTDAEPTEAYSQTGKFDLLVSSPGGATMVTRTSGAPQADFWSSDGKKQKVFIPANFTQPMTHSSDASLFAGCDGRKGELLVTRIGGEVLGKQKLQFENIRSEISCLALSDTNVLAIGTTQGEYKILDLQAATEYPLTGGAEIFGLLWVGDHLWSLEENQVRILHIVGPEKEADETVTIELSLSLPDLFAASANRRRLLVGSTESKSVFVLDTSEKKVIQELKPPLEP